MPDPNPVVTVEAVQLITNALSVTLSRADYDALPDRKWLQRLPVAGTQYRDDSFPGVVFRCNAGIDWSRYHYDTATITWSEHVSHA